MSFGRVTGKCSETPHCTEHQEVYSSFVTEIPATLKAVVTEVYFVGSEISTIPNRAFVNSPQLERVEFLHMPIVSMETHAFEGLDNLMIIEISDTNLTSLPLGLFQNLPILQKLVLKLNKIQKLERGLFDGLRKLKELYLHVNQIASIDEDIFDQLDNLTSLHLAKNRITSISTALFTKLRKLQKLRLYDNLISTIPSGIFNDLPDLKEIGLQEEQLTCPTTRPITTTLPLATATDTKPQWSNNRSFMDLGVCVYVLLSAFAVDTVFGGCPDGCKCVTERSCAKTPQSFRASYLEELSLQDNQIEHLPGHVFSSQQKLKKLYLSNNCLSLLPQGIFLNLPNLVQISLFENQLRSLSSFWSHGPPGTLAVGKPAETGT
ncbi:hypothetical protein SKAU_G00049130 [Synaphobranchus kaupii]|uniref:Uncharacterized protein n=1 Tax=Synaphobranchus kaupii TaxID=118154 RepID=A0A9Q1G2M3_SYNKA|nr:hypothetical protein SKAU_G00049130 [Synaphobranchus kaupii]